MSTRRFLLAAGTLAAVAGVGILLRQNQEIREIRSAIESRRAAPARLSSSANPAPTEFAAASTQTPPSDQRLELMALRRRVTELAEAKRRSAAVVRENATLQQRLSVTTNLAARRFPEGWVQRGDARSAGYGTPEATFETFVWALHHKDTNALFQALIPEAREMLERNLASEGPKEFWRMADAMAGFRIVQVRLEPEDKARLVFEAVPGVPGPEMKLRKIDGAWRLAM